MNTLCLVLVLFTTQIINTKEVSSLDQNKTAPTSTTTRPVTKNLRHGIDFRRVKLFKDDELPSPAHDIKPASNQSKPPITNRWNNGPSATAKEHQISKRIFEDYDIGDLQLNKYKVMVAPNKFKTIDATNVRFVSPNPSSVNNPGGFGIGMNTFDIKVPGKYLNLPTEAYPSAYWPGNYVSNRFSVPEPMANTNSINSVTPIPWVISPACQQQNDSKYVFSAIFYRKPTVHLLSTSDNRTAPNSQTPNIVINGNSVTMSAGNATLKNDSYMRVDPSNTTKNSVVIVVTTGNNTTPAKNPNAEKLKVDGTALKKLTETIQNITKPAVGNSIAISGEIKTNGTDQKPNPPVPSQQNAAAQQIQQQTTQLISNIQANVPAKTPIVTITAQGTKKIEPIPLFLLENNLRETPTPGITINGTLTTAFKKSQQAINNILNSELGGRSFFPPEANRSFKRPTDKKTVGELITQTETDVQPSGSLYELFKNMTMTNVINEDLNRKLLSESQIHTQQNNELIKSSADILHVLKNKNE